METKALALTELSCRVLSVLDQCESSLLGVAASHLSSETRKLLVGEELSVVPSGAENV